MTIKTHCRRVGKTEYACEAHVEGELAGQIDVSIKQDRELGSIAVVEGVFVDDSRRRTRVGTKLYEAAHAQACASGARLASDTTRSDAAESFWRKQLTKGRAQAVAGKAARLDENLEQSGSHGVKRYVMRSACNLGEGLGKARKKR